MTLNNLNQSTMGPKPGKETYYLCACATVDITPLNPTDLAGYTHRAGKSRATSSRLEANIVLLSAGDERILFVAADLLYFGSQLDAELREHASSLGIPGSNVVLTASHTHFAPASDHSKLGLGEADEQYVDFLKARLMGGIDYVVSAPLQAVSLRTSRVAATGLNTVRRKAWPFPILTRAGLEWPPNVVMAPNVKAKCDDEIDAICVETRDGTLVSVFWKYACHPVSFPRRQCVGAEYPGFVRSRLREQVGANMPVLFWQGFAGDVRPNLVGKLSIKEAVSIIRRGPSFNGGVDESDWQDWAGQVADKCAKAVNDVSATTLSGPIWIESTEVPMAVLFGPGTDPILMSKSMRIQRLEFGETLAVTFVAAEVCSPFIRLLSTGERELFVGYSGDVFGYLPSEEQADEGGYEGRDFLDSLGLRGSFRPGFERSIIEVVKDLASRTRRSHSKSSSIG